MDNIYSKFFDTLDRRALEEGRRYYTKLMFGLSEPVKGFTPHPNKKVDVKFTNIAGTEKIGGIISKDTNTILEVYSGEIKVEAEMPGVGAVYTESEYNIKNGNSRLQTVTPKILDDLSRSADIVIYNQYHALAAQGQRSETFTRGTTDPVKLLEWLAEEIDKVKDSNMDRVTLLMSNKFTNLLLTQRIGQTDKMIMSMITDYLNSIGVRKMNFIQALPDGTNTCTAMLINYDYTAAFEGLDPAFERSVHNELAHDITHMYLMAPTIIKSKVPTETMVRELTVTIA